MLFCKYTFECISNLLYLYIYIKPYATVSKNMITFPTSPSEGYTVSSKFLMPVPETD